MEPWGVVRGRSARHIDRITRRDARRAGIGCTGEVGCTGECAPRASRTVDSALRQTVSKRADWICLACLEHDRNLDALVLHAAARLGRVCLASACALKKRSIRLTR